MGVTSKAGTTTLPELLSELLVLVGIVLLGKF